jgi:hypothetical protein
MPHSCLATPQAYQSRLTPAPQSLTLLRYASPLLSYASSIPFYVLTCLAKPHLLSYAIPLLQNASPLLSYASPLLSYTSPIFSYLAHTQLGLPPE